MWLCVVSASRMLLWALWGYGFSSGHVQMWELDCEESWAPKNCCFWTVVLEKTLRVPWTARRSNQSILKEISRGCLLEGLNLSWSRGPLVSTQSEFSQVSSQINGKVGGCAKVTQLVQNQEWKWVFKLVCAYHVTQVFQVTKWGPEGQGHLLELLPIISGRTEPGIQDV